MPLRGSPRPPCEFSEEVLSEALLFTGPWVREDLDPRTRTPFVWLSWLGNRDEFVHCLRGHGEGWKRPREKLGSGITNVRFD
ncbi:putative catabolite repression protein creC [Clarias magur]|uniref:Putative catabolite repression protein creC n=1 Tax=Clarias magur TaxID=1594786 RepID=A0A8J4UVM0_CLAMG|nr:putative catabolite repression protein creC [Clarias magur]